jgi:transcriptional regulator NrdR family protein
MKSFKETERNTQSHICEDCGERSKVTDSRETEDGIKRKRQCPICKKRWATIELCLPAPTTPETT